MEVDKRTAVAICPDCDAEINLGADPRLGQKITCPNCEVELEVVSLDPLELNWDVSESEDEWDDDWDDDDGDDDDLDDDWDDDDWDDDDW
jgi:alpha-aminoadipate carrier protein LysW